MGARRTPGPYSYAAAVRSIIKGAMGREEIESQKELGDLIGISDDTVRKRFASAKWNLLELRQMDKFLNFTDDEVLRLIKYTRK